MGWRWNAMCTSQARIDGKTVIVTGANCGIGKETALDLVKRGGNIIMACRDLEKTESAKNEIETALKDIPNCGKLSSVHLDLNSLASVRACAKQLLAENPKIHILINNAGVMACPHALTEEGYESQIGINHLGHFLLTCLLLPRMKVSAPARIVNVSSITHEYGSINFDDLMFEKSYSALKAYFQSKLAIVLISKELGLRLQGSGVTVYSLHPGVVATNIFRHFKESMIPGATWIINSFVRIFCKSSLQGAQTNIYCAIDEKCANETGLYYAECKVVSESRAARNMETAKKLWKISCELINLGDWDPVKALDTPIQE